MADPSPAPGPPIVLSAKARSAPFSTHARGVPLFNRNRFFDVPRHIARLLLDLRDISSSAFWFLTCQTWLTLWVALTTMCSAVFFTYYGNNDELAADLNWTLTCFVVVLPLVGYGWLAYGRRERALDELSEAKTLMMSLFVAHRDWAGSEGKGAGERMLTVRSALSSLLESMHEYFLANRFYSRYYPYFGFRGSMVQIALDRAAHMRRVGLAMQQLGAANAALGAAGLSAALEAQLHERVLRLHASLDKLSNVKEFRVPQGIRSMARFYVCLFIPIFFGPYWAWVSKMLGFGFCFFFSILLMMALVGVLNLSLSLEDPFDNTGMDGIYIDEALFEVEQLLVGDTVLAPVPAGGGAAEQEQASNGAAAGMADVRASAPAAVQQQQQLRRGQVSMPVPQPAETV